MRILIVSNIPDDNSVFAQFISKLGIKGAPLIAWGVWHGDI